MKSSDSIASCSRTFWWGRRESGQPPASWPHGVGSPNRGSADPEGEAPRWATHAGVGEEGRLAPRVGIPSRVGHRPRRLDGHGGARPWTGFPGRPGCREVGSRGDRHAEDGNWWWVRTGGRCRVAAAEGGAGRLGAGGRAVPEMYRRGARRRRGRLGRQDSTWSIECDCQPLLTLTMAYDRRAFSSADS